VQSLQTQNRLLQSNVEDARKFANMEAEKKELEGGCERVRERERECEREHERENAQALQELVTEYKDQVYMCVRILCVCKYVYVRVCGCV